MLLLATALFCSMYLLINVISSIAKNKDEMGGGPRLILMGITSLLWGFFYWIS